MTEGLVPAGDVRLEDLLRELAPQVLGALVRRHGQFDACEDAVQEALLAAAQQWPQDGLPDNPRGWLVAVARRRLVDTWRSESARERREETAALLDPNDPRHPSDPFDAFDPFDETAAEVADQDDTLVLLFMCCHPSLSQPSQLALTLRAVGGLTTSEIAKAFLVPESTMAQRISRAKQSIRSAGLHFDLPPEAERAERLRVVMHVLYLIFNEGYASSSGPVASRAELTGEAIRLTRMLHRLSPDPEVSGLLALMLLTEARRPARVVDGLLVPLSEQDRTRWDADLVAQGIALVTAALGQGPAGPYQLQAAIAAVHDEARTAEETDWPQILALYQVLDVVAPSPVVTLNRAVAVAMVHGPRAGLALLGTLEDDDRMSQTHRLAAVRGHLLELAGDLAGALEAYRSAARMTQSQQERDYLTVRATRLAAASEPQRAD